MNPATRQPDRAIADTCRDVMSGEAARAVKAVEEARATLERAQAQCIYWGSAYRDTAEKCSAAGEHIRANSLFRAAAIEYEAAGMSVAATGCRDKIREQAS